MRDLVAKVAVSGISYNIDHTYTYLVPPTLADGLREGTRVLVPFGPRNRRTEAMVLELCKNDESVKGLKKITRALETTPVFDRELLRLALWVRERCFCTFYEAAKAMLPSGIWYALEDELRPADGFDVESALSLTVNDDERRLVELVGSKAKVSDLEGPVGAAFAKTAKVLVDRGVLVRDTAAVRKVGDKMVKIYRLADPSGVDAYLDKTKMKSPKRCDIARFVRDAGEDGAAAGEITYFTGHAQRIISGMVKAGVLTEESRTTYRRPYSGDPTPREAVTLTPEQTAAATRLRELLRGGKAAAALLYGVTGSGKTEVYINLIHAALDDGKGAMVLAPEIALTPQLMRIFRSCFGDRVAILHSALTAGERADEWRRIKNGDADVVLGTRSAAFAPVKNPGLFIMDEEQERSYKSDSMPRYHARDVLLRRAASLDALVVLGSATPSIESYHAAKTGRYVLVELQSRFTGRSMPRVEIADMQEELKGANSGSISRLLATRIEQTIERGEQVILFINRRGNSRRVVCPDCGWTPECGNCSVPLTYHSANGRLMCHYCGVSTPVPDVCPTCGGALKFTVVGTQRCEEELRKMFPDVGILRMDSDVTQPRGSHEDILSDFRERKASILLGTQMVAKGLDFENVTLVGVISADQSLYADDIRANERTFSIVTQVVGRSGRGASEGSAVLQTLQPDNPVILAAATQDYDGFYESEIRMRERFGYPPFCDYIAVEISGANPDGTMRAAFETRERLRALVSANDIEVSIIGPAQASIFRIKNRYRYRLMLGVRLSKKILLAVSATIKQFKADRAMKDYSIFADVNPSDS